MKDLLISPRILKGKVLVPPSKSLGHRAIICAALAVGCSVLKNIGDSDDITATINAMEAFGAHILRQGSTLIVNGINEPQGATVHCNESGSTLRFLIPLALLTERTSFVGSGRLMERPLDVYFKLFDKSGIDYTYNANRITVNKGMPVNPIKIQGDVSSQFVSGLLLTLPLFDSDFTIEMETHLESRAYVDLTIDVMKHFGVHIINEDYNRFIVKGGQRYKPTNYVCENDFSQAAFFLTAGAIGSDVYCGGLTTKSGQGDKAILDILLAMGSQIEMADGLVRVVPSDLKGIDIDAASIPDLIPPLAVAACLAKGETNIYNAKRLRLKESDRLKSLSDQLRAIGADITQKQDGLLIRGVDGFTQGVVSGSGDHRIAMTLAVAASRAKADIILKGGDCVNKSYPCFWNDYKRLGGVCHDWKQD